MATVSFHKNLVISETKAIDDLIEVLTSGEIRPTVIDKELASAKEMARGEEILKHCLSLSKDS